MQQIGSVLVTKLCRMDGSFIITGKVRPDNLFLREMIFDGNAWKMTGGPGFLPLLDPGPPWCCN